MSTGTALIITLTVTVLLVAGGVTYAAFVHASATARRNEAGYISNTECAQADHTAVLVVVGTLLLTAFLIFGLPLAVDLGRGLTPAPAAETSTTSNASETRTNHL